jgi:hypothetical protein
VSASLLAAHILCGLLLEPDGTLRTHFDVPITVGRCGAGLRSKRPSPGSTMAAGCGRHYRGPTSLSRTASALDRARERSAPAKWDEVELSTQAQALDDRAVPVDVGFGEVVQQSAALADQ